MKSAPRRAKPARPASRAGAETSELERGREAYAARAWRDACEALSRADRESSLADVDLERLAWPAALAGNTGAFCAAVERLHDLRCAAEEPLRAARAAFWLGMRLFTTGEVGRASGWVGRLERLVENQSDCAERGYLLI